MKTLYLTKEEAALLDDDDRRRLAASGESVVIVGSQEEAERKSLEEEFATNAPPHAEGSPPNSPAPVEATSSEPAELLADEDAAAGADAEGADDGLAAMIARQTELLESIAASNLRILAALETAGPAVTRALVTAGDVKAAGTPSQATPRYVSPGETKWVQWRPSDLGSAPPSDPDEIRLLYERLRYLEQAVGVAHPEDDDD